MRPATTGGVRREHDSAAEQIPRGRQGPRRADHPVYAEPAHAGIPAYNAQIEALVATYGAQLVKGPDLYTVIYDGRATMFTIPRICTPTRPEMPR